MSLFACQANFTNLDSKTEVYFYKGDTLCNDDGLSLSQVSAYLTISNVSFTSSTCASITGLAVAAVCGGSTQNIYIHSINSSDLALAENLGFIDLSSLPSEEYGYSIKACQ
tara:strand:- start:8654 stop:8986 length:333 start_codon:yes stop_codon:yes gene_type:complete